MTVVLAALVGLACTLAGARRLWLGIAPSGFDHDLLARALRDATALRRLRDGLEARGTDSLERSLVAAASGEDVASRDALIDEQVIEANWQVLRWAPVPRVCASISTSAGFLCACVSVIQTLAVDPGDAGVAPSLRSALAAVAFGIAGASFCIAVHVRLRPLMSHRRAATVRLVDRLRTLGQGAV
jgi:hypothetical protein